MKLESLKSEKFEVLKRNQMSSITGGAYEKSMDYLDKDLNPIKDRKEYFLNESGERTFTGCVELQRKDGTWVSEADYWR